MSDTAPALPQTMRAAVVRAPGPPEVLQVETLPVAVPPAGQVSIRVRAFGLNRSEMFTRRGLSPGVRFPRVLGIEAVGIVAAAPGGEFAPGATVATVMGGMGRDFDGSYAEYVVVPARQVREIPATLGWDVLGALPEMLQTAWGALYRALRLRENETLLIRGGTTSVGLAAAAIASARGAHVISKTRRPEREATLRAAGAAEVVIDTGSIADDVLRAHPDGVDNVLELVGASTLADSLQCAAEGGAVAMTGMVGNAWSLPDFSPMEAIPTGVSLTTYAGDVEDFERMPLGELVAQVASNALPVRVGRVFGLDDIVAAHRLMESDAAVGKIVVLP